MLTANKRLQREESKKSFSLTARKAVTMACCHGVRQLETAVFQAPGYEEKATSEEKTIGQQKVLSLGCRGLQGPGSKQSFQMKGTVEV